jgi:hypothetical protein
VQECLKAIEKKLDWGNSREWHNEMFGELSDRIQMQTQVLLSPTTLKRLWGRLHYQNSPSITTLNTIARFAGYENWRDFKNQSAPGQFVRLRKKVNAQLGIIMLAASVMTLVFISLYSLKGTTKVRDSIDISRVHFNSRPVSSGLPNSVVFNTDLAGIQSDSIYIQQYWDPEKTIKLKNGQTQATGQYFFPGYFEAKLLVDGVVLKKHDLFIKSGGWMATLDYQPIPKYISSTEIIHGGMSLPAPILRELKEQEDPLSSTYHLVEDFKEQVSGDNFILNTTLKNVYKDKWAVCQRTYIMVLGTRGSIIIPFSIPGCVSELELMMSDVYLEGTEHDLSGLGIDLSTYRDITIDVKNRQVTVSAEGLELFSGSYHDTLGRIVGLRYRFVGAGEVAAVTLTTPDKQSVMIADTFSAP